MIVENKESVKKEEISKVKSEGINKKTTIKYSLIALFMFGFGFALSPMYTLFCSVTGLNGRTVNAENQKVNVEVDLSREIKVRFITTTHTDLPWEFEANETWITVHPGELNKATFRVKNNGKTAITGQAIPSLAPTIAANHFIKTECFCFDTQTLEAGEVANMPLQFYIEPEIPDYVGSVFLTYQFFNTKKKQVSTSTTASLNL